MSLRFLIVVLISLPLACIFGSEKDRTSVFLGEMKNHALPLLPVSSGSKARYCLPLSFDELLKDYKQDKVRVMARLQKYCEDKVEHQILLDLVPVFAEKPFRSVSCDSRSKLGFYWLDADGIKLPDSK
jgi:hypothetical protein